MKKSTKSPGILVELQNINLTLGARRVLSKVSWNVRRGEGWLVTGLNGAGKTSLLRILAGRIWPDPGERGGRRIYHFDGRLSASPIGLEGRIAWLSPETHQRFAKLEAPIMAGDVVLTGFANTFLLTHRPTVQQRARALRLAKKLSVTQFWRRPFTELSQGQQRLVLLARALVSKPKLLVLDEFSDGLDQPTRVCVGAVLVQRLRAGAAVVVAAHRASDVLSGLTQHLTLRKGVAEVVPLPAKGREAIGAPKIRSSRGKAKQSLAKPTLEFTHASVAVGDHVRTHRILHNLDWTVLTSEHWAVLGSNGSGKSTLLRVIYGELSVVRGGLLRRFGCDEIALPLPEARRRIGFVSPALQHHYATDVTVAEVVASGFQSTVGLLRRPTHVEISKSRAILQKLGIGLLVGRRWGALSFGEARLALLARALVFNPRLLLLDEPCDGLSPLARRRFLHIVERAARDGAQIIIAAHRAEDLPACINRVLRLHNGRMI